MNCFMIHYHSEGKVPLNPHKLPHLLTINPDQMSLNHQIVVALFLPFTWLGPASGANLKASPSCATAARTTSSFSSAGPCRLGHGVLEKNPYVLGN